MRVKNTAHILTHGVTVAIQLAQIMVGLEALKVDLRALRGALLMGATLGNLRETLEYVRECSLRVLLGATMQVLMI